MKRWGFKGQGASHGTSLSHRSGGSIGMRKDPGKVWKGKKMAGQMGGDYVTVLGLEVVKVDKEMDLIYVKGSIPGPKNTIVKVRDAAGKDDQFDPYTAPPPFPTRTQKELAELPAEMTAPAKAADPLAARYNL
jgi:large subunit ribosomal protein L3